MGNFEIVNPQLARSNMMLAYLAEVIVPEFTNKKGVSFVSGASITEGNKERQEVIRAFFEEGCFYKSNTGLRLLNRESRPRKLFINGGTPAIRDLMAYLQYNVKSTSPIFSKRFEKVNAAYANLVRTSQ